MKIVKMKTVKMKTVKMKTAKTMRVEIETAMNSTKLTIGMRWMTTEQFPSFHALHRSLQKPPIC
jgi:hypothetical protein